MLQSECTPIEKLFETWKMCAISTDPLGAMADYLLVTLDGRVINEVECEDDEI